MNNRNESIWQNGYEHVPFVQANLFDPVEMVQRSKEYYHWLNQRRSIRMISDRPVPKQIIENIIKTASTAPSGAHKQPWTFCAVSDPVLKKQIRIAAEQEEKLSYESRMSEQWKNDLKPLGTDMNKPFLKEAPWLIIVFKKSYDLLEDGTQSKNYYVNESVGIACGFLISAIHHAGLVTLTHTPSPMNFLGELLNRPKNERAYILFPVGYASADANVPNIRRKSLDECAVFYEKPTT